MANDLNQAIELAGAMVGGGLALGGGAIGAAIGDRSGRQPDDRRRRPPTEAQGRLFTIMFIIVGLVEAITSSISVFMVLFVFVLARSSDGGLGWMLFASAGAASSGNGGNFLIRTAPSSSSW